MGFWVFIGWFWVILNCVTICESGLFTGFCRSGVRGGFGVEWENCVDFVTTWIFGVEV